MNWIELVQDEAKRFDVYLTPETSDYLLWEHTGFPGYWEGEPEVSCRAQIREVLHENLYRWQIAYPPPPREQTGPTAYALLQDDFLDK